MVIRRVSGVVETYNLKAGFYSMEQVKLVLFIVCMQQVTNNYSASTHRHFVLMLQDSLASQCPFLMLTVL